MAEFNAVAEVDIAPAKKCMEQWVEMLAGYSPVISATERLRSEIVITVEAAVLEAATAEALAVLQRAAGQLRSFEIMTAQEYDRRTDEIGDAEYLGVSDVTELLNVSRQRVQKLAADGLLPSIRIGKGTLAFPRSAIRAIAMRRVSGEQLMAAALEVIRFRPDLQPQVKKIMPVLASGDRPPDGPHSAREDSALTQLFELFDQAGVTWPKPTLDVARGR